MNTLKISGSALDTLAVSAKRNGEDLETALRKSIALYVECSKGVEKGLSAGLAKNPDDLETRFTNIGPSTND